MKDAIRDEYQKIKDKISYDDFLARIEEMKKEYEDVSFMDDLDVARMVVGEFKDEKNASHRDKSFKISDLEVGIDDASIIGRVMRISNIKTFTTRKGRDGKVANLMIADDTGKMRVVLWNEKVALLKKIREGDVIKIGNAHVKDGFRSDEIHLQSRSTIVKLEDSAFQHLPPYREDIINIADIKEGMEVNVIARIKRISRVRRFESDGREGKVVSLELQDETGTIPFTLWNRDVKLIDELNLGEGDSVKILGAQSRVRNGEISLTHSWIGRIIKGDFDVPEHEEVILKLADAHEMKDVTVMGVVTKIQDSINFERADGTTGAVRSIVIADDTGSIKVTLWNEDADLRIKKGDILKIIGGNIEFDEYSETGYRVNTNWSTRIIINPDSNNSLIKVLEEYKKHLKPVKIGDLKDFEDEGEEVDIVGRIIGVNEPREFQRSDGTAGVVRTVEIADDTGFVRASFWDDKVDIGFNIGDAIKIENARTRFGIKNIELSVGKTARVMKASENDMEGLPPLDKLEEMIYKTKKIEEIEEDDRNIKVTGQIIEAYGERILYEMCPNCNKRLEFIDDAYICDLCGEEIQDPNYLMIIPCVIEDDTDSIRVTFFRKQAEELIGMTTQEAHDVIDKTADEGSLAEKIDDLTGKNITIIADANFDEYNEEVRLNARKIIDMKF